jgi:hypothetical protein
VTEAASTRWRSLRLLAVLLTGVVLGAVVTLVVQDRGAADDTASPPANASGPAASDAEDDGGGAGTADPALPTQQVLLAWQVDPLPVGLGQAVAALDGVEQTTTVRHATVGFVGARVDGQPAPGPAAGTVAPVDLVAVDPTTYPTFVPPELAATFAGLGPRDVVLGRTSARLRGLDVGDVVDLAPLDITVRPTISFVVAAVVDDVVIGGAELAVDTGAGRELGLEADRYLLVAHHGDRATLEDGILEQVDGAIRFRGPGETPYLRDGDAVLPQAIVKAAFGEFTIGWSPAGLTQEPSWPAANLVDVDVAVLGSVRCHRGVIDDLRAAMDQIEREQLAYLIDPTPSSLACYYPDVIERSGALSRGYWGIAVVLNSGKNPTGSGSVQDPRVVAIMQEHGFTWGGDFLVSEPAYFEHVGPTVTDQHRP